MAKNKASRRTYTGHFLTTIWQKLEEVQEELGYAEFMDTLNYLIVFGHDKIVNSYRTNTRSRPVREPQTPEESAQKRVAREKAERDARMSIINQESESICEALEGEIIDHGNGFRSCRFNQYDLSTPKYVSVGTLEVPFDQLTTTHVGNQYKTDLPGYSGVDIKDRILEVLTRQDNNQE